MTTTFRWNGEELMRKMRVPARDMLLGLVRDYERILQESFRGQKTGRLYRVSKTGPLHQASAPGEPPAILTGRLRQSVVFELTERGDGIEAVIGSSVKDYPAMLEFGTSRMEPRPAWIPALDLLRKIVKQKGVK